MPIRLSDVAAQVGFEVRRDGAFSALGFLPATDGRMLAFAESAPMLARALSQGNIVAVVTTPELAPQVRTACGLAVCAHPKRAFFILQNYLAGNTSFYSPAPASNIDPAARVHAAAYIDPCGVSIAAWARIDANATVLSATAIGERAHIFSGAVIGASGFQSLRGEGDLIEMTHTGNVEIAADAVVMANATVARGVFRETTRVGEQSRIGNNAFVSHHVTVGRRAFIGHGAVINGNVQIGDEAWIGPGAIICNDVQVGTGAYVGLGSVVIRDVAAMARVSGNPAQPQRMFLRAALGGDLRKDR